MNIQSVLVAVLLSVSLSTAAANRDTVDNKIRTWNAKHEYHSVVVSNNINIILAEDSSSLISIQGKSRLVDAVDLFVRDGVLHISSSRTPFINKTVVYIPVRMLSRLTVKGASQVYSMGHLKSEHLRIDVEGPCSVHVKNTGAITIGHEQEWEVEYLKRKGAVRQGKSLKA